MQNWIWRTMFLYFFLLAGGVWHIAGYFQELMRQGSGWLMIALGGWLFLELIASRKGEDGKPLENNRFRKKILVTGAAVVFLTWGVEWLGVHTGLIFGSYDYGAVLQPQIAGVPLAIGFAWFTLLGSATALERHMPLTPADEKLTLRALRIAALMALFDLFMETVAIKLGYWSWNSDRIPLQNFAAWFIISYVLAETSLRLKVWPVVFPAISVHFYLAQMLYFGLVYLA